MSASEKLSPRIKSAQQQEFCPCRRPVGCWLSHPNQSGGARFLVPHSAHGISGRWEDQGGSSRAAVRRTLLLEHCLENVQHPRLLLPKVITHRTVCEAYPSAEIRVGEIRVTALPVCGARQGGKGAFESQLTTGATSPVEGRSLLRRVNGVRAAGRGVLIREIRDDRAGFGLRSRGARVRGESVQEGTTVPHGCDVCVTGQATGGRRAGALRHARGRDLHPGTRGPGQRG